MNGKLPSIKGAVAAFMAKHAVPGEMEQNLIKETIHLHLLSALSDAGVLRHVVFQGGSALRLCYGGERYSDDLDFVCGKRGAYVEAIEFEKLVQNALEAAKGSLHRNFGIDPNHVTLKQPSDPMGIKNETVSVTSWQIIVPVTSTPHSPKSIIKIEFANVPSYDSRPNVAKVTQGLAQIQDVILSVESANEILADKAVALTARTVLKYRDVWDVWYLVNRLNAQVDRETVAKKFSDYGTTDVLTKAKRQSQILAQDSTVNSFVREMKRFLPAKRVAEMENAGLHKVILAASAALIERAVLPH